MKLKYNILWIENETDWAESIEDQIQEYLEDLGFDFERKLISKEEKDINYNEYDLILMDLNLAEQPNGAELIYKIRRLDVYTDVVFYSANGIEELKAKGREKELEGVYYSGRTPDSLFVKKVKAVIDSTIKKFHDIVAIRGMIMHETSSLDAQIDNLIQAYLECDSTIKCDKCVNKEKCQPISNDVISKMESQFNRKLELITKKNFRTIRKDFFLFSADYKRIVLGKLLEAHGLEDFSQEYKDNIINIRNKFAHAVLSSDEEGRLCFRSKDQTLIFDETLCKKIRLDIRKYKDLIDKAESIILRKER